MTHPEAPDGALEQVLRVLDKLPFVSGLKRDVSSLRELLYQRRAPRIAVIGRPGSGRTRLGNALLDKDALPAGSEDPKDGQWIRVEAGGAVLEWIEIDSQQGRGEAVLDRALAEAQPDCVLFVVSPATAHDWEEDLLHLPPLVARMNRAGDGTLRIIPVLAQSDLIATPHAGGAPADGGPLAEERLTVIDLGRQRLQKLVDAAGLRAAPALAVAAPKGPERALHLEQLSLAMVEELTDPARLEGARALAHAGRARRELANRIVHCCSTLALTVGLAPVPLSDAFVIAPLQVVMVSAVAHLGGRPWDRKAVLEWMASMGLVGGAGFGLRWTAQQLVKLIPGAGSLVSAGVAGAGTVTLGQSAIAYFLRDAGRTQIPESVAA